MPYLAWAAAGILTAALGSRRWIEATSVRHPDLQDYLLPAARLVRTGQSPYTLVGYFYPPVVPALLAPFANASWVETAWTSMLLGVAVLACLLGAIAAAPEASSVLRAIVFTFAATSLLASWPLTMELWLGNVELVLLATVAAAMLGAAANRRGGFGLWIGVAAAIKTWPAFLLLWLLRRPLRTRSREWAAVAGVAALVVALTASLGGFTTLTTLATQTLHGAEQHLVAYSAWGAGQLLFADTGLSAPLVVSPLLSATLTGLLFAWLGAALLVVLLRPGDRVIAIANLAFCMILLLPVSHYGYVIVALPALWWWLGRALETPTRLAAWGVTVLLLIWWFVAFRRIPSVGPDSVTNAAEYVLHLGSTLLAATVSILAAAVLGSRSTRGATSAVGADRNG